MLSAAKSDTILAWFRKLARRSLTAPGTASLRVASNVTNSSAVCSSSINAPHEYFDPTGPRRDPTHDRRING